MFDAQAWLDTVRDAVMTLRRDEWRRMQLRESPQSVTSSFRQSAVSHTPNPDKMGRIDELIDLESGWKHRIESAQALLAEANAVLDGMRSVGVLEAEASDVLRFVYVMGYSKSGAARAMLMSRSTACKRHDYGVGWLSAVGLAHAKAGIGSAER